MSTPRYAVTASDKQKQLLDRLLKDPQKPVVIPEAPQEKIVRPAREMMKNVQGSSAGAGSGEFHVYKAGRRWEFERLKIMEDEALKETADAEFERKKREAEAVAEAKTAKNRAKRQKKKGRSKGQARATTTAQTGQDAPVKKRRLVDGKELVFKKPGEEESDEEEEQEEQPVAALDSIPEPSEPVEAPAPAAVAEEQRIIIHED